MKKLRIACYGRCFWSVPVAEVLDQALFGRKRYVAESKDGGFFTKRYFCDFGVAGIRLLMIAVGDGHGHCDAL